MKLGQGIERHLSGGTAAAWLGHFLLLVGYVVGAVVGGVISLFAGGTWMLVIATVVCALATGYTHRYVYRRGVFG